MTIVMSTRARPSMLCLISPEGGRLDPAIGWSSALRQRSHGSQKEPATKTPRRAGLSGTRCCYNLYFECGAYHLSPIMRCSKGRGSRASAALFGTHKSGGLTWALRERPRQIRNVQDHAREQTFTLRDQLRRQWELNRRRGT